MRKLKQRSLAAVLIVALLASALGVFNIGAAEKIRIENLETDSSTYKHAIDSTSGTPYQRHINSLLKDFPCRQRSLVIGITLPDLIAKINLFFYSTKLAAVPTNCLTLCLAL